MRSSPSPARMIRPSSKRSVGSFAPLAILAAACTRQPAGPRFATARELPEVPRRPDGVVVDPSPELPEASEEGASSGALVALKPPLPEKAARTVVAAYFRAIV